MGNGTRAALLLRWAGECEAQVASLRAAAAQDQSRDSFDLRAKIHNLLKNAEAYRKAADRAARFPEAPR